MRGSRKFFQSGSKVDNVFFIYLFLDDDKGIEDTNTAINGPSSTAGLVAWGIGPVLQRNPIFL